MRNATRTHILYVAENLEIIKKCKIIGIISALISVLCLSL